MSTKDKKSWALNTAIEITKEYARGGGSEPAVVLEDTYKKLLDLIVESDKED